MSKAKERARLRRQQAKSSKPKRSSGGVPKKTTGIVKGARKPAPKSSKAGARRPSNPISPAVTPARAPSSAHSHSVPFSAEQRILLVGEGDFSFSVSLLRTHGCRRLVSSTLETRGSLLGKHPQAAGHIRALEAGGARVLYGVDGTALTHATRGGGQALRRLGPFDRIVFNFPHTGGLSSDVNRQVRANQELVAGFLRCAVGDREGVLARGGRVVVTLFEGQPYELWGIRNLARHVGLVVVRSARFEWDRFPGYSHARTLGNLRGDGGWKGEEREARVYVFGRPGEEEVEVERKGRRAKGGDGESDSESEVGDGGGWEDVDEVGSDGMGGEEGQDDGEDFEGFGDDESASENEA